MPMNENSRRESEYLAAHDLATNLLRKGEIRAFSATHERERGRVIYTETDQGWNPDPMYEEFSPETEAEYSFAL